MKTRIKLFFVAICFLSALSANAQEAFEFSKNQTQVWSLATTRTIAVAKAMPESKYNFSPVAGLKSFGQQMSHIANSLLSTHTRFILDKNYSGREKDASKMTKDQIIEELEEAFDRVIEDLKNLSDKSLMATGKSHGAFSLTKWQSFLFMRDHITNHRAKAVLYLRLNNIDPPSYGFN